MYFAILNIGEIVVIVLVMLIFFGGSRLPLLGKSIGEGLRNFRKSLSNKENDDDLPKITEVQNNKNTKQSSPHHAE